MDRHLHKWCPLEAGRLNRQPLHSASYLSFFWFRNINPNSGTGICLLKRLLDRACSLPPEVRQETLVKSVADSGEATAADGLAATLVCLSLWQPTKRNRLATAGRMDIFLHL